ncbi:hypothetical protein V6N13_142483 [Hibiscus sabdariffa]
MLSEAKDIIPFQSCLVPVLSGDVPVSQHNFHEQLLNHFQEQSSTAPHDRDEDVEAAVSYQGHECLDALTDSMPSPDLQPQEEADCSSTQATGSQDGLIQNASNDAIHDAVEEVTHNAQHDESNIRTSDQQTSSSRSCANMAS